MNRHAPFFTFSIRAVLCAGILSIVAPSAKAEPLYSIVPLGIDDAEHTRLGQTKSSTAFQMNEAGQVRGVSLRYDGGGNSLGQSVWLYEGATTINIGLIGTEHTRGDDYKYSSASSLNEAGQVSGNSQRYNGEGSSRGYSAWLHSGGTTTNIGLADVEHTGLNDYKYSVSMKLNEAGQVIGESERSDAEGSWLGNSAWLHSGGTTTNIGLIDIEHTRDDNFKTSYVQQLTDSGRANGLSERFNGGGIHLGYSAWLHEGGTTTNIGLVDAEHTNIDDYKVSYSQKLNEAGQAIGLSERFSDWGMALGQSAWIHNGGTTSKIGLLDAEHTGDSDYKYSEAKQMNEAGQVIGFSRRFEDWALHDTGESAWFYDAGTTTKIGLFDAEHTGWDDYKWSQAQKLNEAGHVIGHSERFDGSGEWRGRSAWLHKGGTTTNIGLVDAEHTGGNDYRHSAADQMNEAGHVIGYSHRRNGGIANLGQSAWLHDSETTTKIGLIDAEHTGSNDYKFSEAQHLNESGQVAGFSFRYNDVGMSRGTSAWFHENGTTTNIGMIDAEHTQDNGGKSSFVEQLNESGQVRGYSTRYHGGASQLGRTAWIYDAAAGDTFALVLSTRSDGYAFSSAVYLGDDGLTLGYYHLIDEADNNLGNRAFYFTIDEGLFDLGLLVDDGLDANGWQLLAQSIRANGLGQILGHGLLNSQTGGSFAYLLTPITTPVPEPSSLALVVLGLLGFWGWRRIFP